jgi:hypothetical protein
LIYLRVPLGMRLCVCLIRRDNLFRFCIMRRHNQFNFFWFLCLVAFLVILLKISGLDHAYHILMLLELKPFRKSTMRLLLGHGGWVETCWLRGIIIFQCFLIILRLVTRVVRLGLDLFWFLRRLLGKRTTLNGFFIYIFAYRIFFLLFVTVYFINLFLVFSLLSSVKFWKFIICFS